MQLHAIASAVASPAADFIPPNYDGFFPAWVDVAVFVGAIVGLVSLVIPLMMHLSNTKPRSWGWFMAGIVSVVTIVGAPSIYLGNAYDIADFWLTSGLRIWHLACIPGIIASLLVIEINYAWEGAQ